MLQHDLAVSLQALPPVLAIVNVALKHFLHHQLIYVFLLPLLVFVLHLFCCCGHTWLLLRPARRLSPISFLAMHCDPWQNAARQLRLYINGHQMWHSSHIHTHTFPQTSFVCVCFFFAICNLCQRLMQSSAQRFKCQTNCGHRGDYFKASSLPLLTCIQKKRFKFEWSIVGRLYAYPVLQWLM